MKTKEKIDFVVLWVDGNDPKWIEIKNKELEKIGYSTDNRNARYRDWDNMRYWFRGVEKFAPWVNKVHFVTYGHLPQWLNKDCPKLSIVNHSDFIPEEYLPLFNSSAIEANIHRIEGLTENFVYFNDDMFLINDVREQDFFVNNKPVTFGCFVKRIPQSRIDEDPYFGMLSKNGDVISKLYNKKNTIFKHPLLFYNFKYGKHVLSNVRTLLDDSYVIDSTHMPQAFKKSAFEYMWKNDFDTLDETSKSKFRNKNNINQDLFKSQQVLSGNFYPQSKNIGRPLFFSNEEHLKSVIENQMFKMCCVADDVSDDDFESAVERLKSYFDLILPEKSQFEL